LETFDEDSNEMMTIVADEVTEWESLLPSPAVTFVPRSGASGTPAASLLQPDATTAKLIDADTNTDVAQFNYYTDLYKADNVNGTLVNIDPISYADGNGLTFAAIIKCVAGLADVPPTRGQSICSLSGDDKIQTGTRKYVYFYLYGHATIGYAVRIDTYTGNSQCYGFTPLAGKLDDAGWLLIVGQYLPQEDDTRHMKLYIGTSTTITEYDEVGFTSSTGVDTGYGSLDDGLSTVKATIGAKCDGLTTGTVTEPLRADMPTNDAWAVVLTQAEIKQVFKYYKNKYPNIFTYDPETIGA